MIKADTWWDGHGATPLHGPKTVLMALQAVKLQHPDGYATAVNRFANHIGHYDLHTWNQQQANEAEVCAALEACADGLVED